MGILMHFQIRICLAMKVINGDVRLHFYQLRSKGIRTGKSQPMTGIGTRNLARLYRQSKE